MKDKGRNVYVHLNHDQDAASHRQRYYAGLVPDKTPYGYHHLESWGYHLAFSRSDKESRAENLLRRVVRRLMGFDLWHVWRNRNQMIGVDVILTYSENGYLPIMLLRKLGISPTNTLLVANSLWLFSIWEELPRWRQKLYHWLIRSDPRTVLTAFASEGVKSARSLFPGMRSELLLFGISLDSFPLKPPTFEYERETRPLRLSSIGSDPWRDWETLLGAVEGNRDIEARFAANLSYDQNRLLKRLVDDNNQISGHIQIEWYGSLRRLREAYEWADIVAISSLPNKHASGTTVVLEAVASGKPVIATDAGGLKGYFSDDEIYYVPPRNIEALAVAIEESATKADNTLLRAKNAQAKFVSADLSTKGLASRYVALIEDILSSS